MARFRYRMQSILNIKVKLETQAKQEFGQAQQLLNIEEEKLDNLILRKKNYEDETRESLQGTLSVKDIRDNQTAIRTMDSYIKAQVLQVQMAQRNVDKARERLTEAMMERKAQETLRQKAFENYVKEENKAEMKEIDQLTSYTYTKSLMESEMVGADYANEG